MRISLIWHKTKYNYNSIKDKLMPALWTRTPNWFNHIYTKTAAEVGPSTHDKRYPGFGAIKEIYCKSDPAITTLIWVSSPKEDKSNQFSVWIAGVSEKYQIHILHFFFFFFLGMSSETVLRITTERTTLRKRKLVFWSLYLACIAFSHHIVNVWFKLLSLYLHLDHRKTSNHCLEAKPRY